MLRAIKGEDVDAVATLISIHKDQISIVNGLWAIYQGVSLALLGYVFSQEFVRKNPWILGFFTAAFLFFSVANQRAILRSQEIIYAAALELKSMSSLPETHQHLRAVLKSYNAVPVSTLEFGHSAFAALVVSSIWALFFISWLQSKRAAPRIPRFRLRKSK
jgi:hypothetical protein